MKKKILITKKILIRTFPIVILIISSTKTINAEYQNWEIEKNFTDKNLIYESPSITISNNTIHLIWLINNIENSEIIYTKSKDNGKNWDEKKIINQNKTIIETPSISSYKHNIHIVWKDYRTEYPEIFYKKSIDNGKTWENEKQLTFNHTRIYDIYDLKIIVDKNDIYLTWKDYRHGSSEIYYKHSPDNGETWTEDARITNDYSPSYAPSITVENKNIIITWDDWGDEAQIHMRLSQDQGKTWDKQIKITNTSGKSKNSQITLVNNKTHLVWQDERNGKWDIYYKKSDNFGQTWTDEIKITNSKYDSYSPKITIYQNNIIILWHENQDNMSISKYITSSNSDIWSNETILTNNSINTYESMIKKTQNRIHFICKYETLDKLNGIFYANKFNDKLKISSIKIEKYILKPAEKIKIIVTRVPNKLFQDISCIVECNKSIMEKFIINMTNKNDYWEGELLYNKNLPEGIYSIKAKLIDKNGNQSQWYTHPEKIQIIHPIKTNESPDFNFILILSSIIIFFIFYKIKRRQENEK